MEAKVIITGEVYGNEWNFLKKKISISIRKKKKKKERMKKKAQYCICDFPKGGKKYQETDSGDQKRKMSNLQSPLAILLETLVQQH